MIDFIKNYNTREIVSSSLLLTVDNLANKYKIKWIDFGRVLDLPKGQKRDTNLLFGFV